MKKFLKNLDLVLKKSAGAPSAHNNYAGKGQNPERTLNSKALMRADGRRRGSIHNDQKTRFAPVYLRACMQPARSAYFSGAGVQAASPPAQGKKDATNAGGDTGGAGVGNPPPPGSGAAPQARTKSSHPRHEGGGVSAAVQAAFVAVPERSEGRASAAVQAALLGGCNYG
jgi:hypothetical protein